jgi:hypothetical protein
MKEYDVSFEICTKFKTLSELSELIGLTCSEDSHEKGQPRGRKRIWEETYWKLFSSELRSAPIGKHFENIFSQLSHSNTLLPESRFLFPEDCSFYLSIGVFFNENSEGNLFEISPQVMERINSYKVDIEVCLYPSSMKEN